MNVSLFKNVEPEFFPRGTALSQYTNASDDLPVNNNALLRVSKFYKGVTEDSVLLGYDAVLHGVIG
jgi:hypothetical protein